MNKRKIVMMALSIMMVAILAIGGSLAYLTDTDNANNTFTVGNVAIELIEQQRKEDENGDKTTELEKFENEKVLQPVVGSAQGEKDDIGMPTAANYADKIITVKTGKNSQDAYIRVYLAIPSVLDNVKDAGMNVLHFNWGNNLTNDKYSAADHANWGAETLVAKEFEMADGIKYNIYYRSYNKILPENTETGSAAYVGFYLDKNVDYDGKDYTINGKVIDFAFENGITIPVYAIGVQAAGFNTADEAIEAAFGADYNPWAAN